MTAPRAGGTLAVMSLDQLIGTAPGAFIAMTVILFGGVALLTGQSLAAGWKPRWTIIPAGLGLAAIDRFLQYGMFGGQLWHLSGFLLSAALLTGIAFTTFRAVHAHKMVMQYPWRYERAGLFNWRAKSQP